MVKTFPGFGRKNGEPKETRRRMSEMLSEWVHIRTFRPPKWANMDHMFKEAFTLFYCFKLRLFDMLDSCRPYWSRLLWILDQGCSKHMMLKFDRGRHCVGGLKVFQ